MTEKKEKEGTEEVKEESRAEESKEEVKEEKTEGQPEAEIEEEEKKEENQPKVEEKTTEAPKEVLQQTQDKKEKAEPSGKFKDLIKQIEGLSVIELSGLVKELEDRFGVSAAAPVAMAPVAGAAPAAGGEAAEEKSTYTVVLTTAGGNKIAAIKAVREVNNTLGLKEAKDLVEGAPKTVKENVPKEEAEEAKKKLEEAGVTVELK